MTVFTRFFGRFGVMGKIAGFGANIVAICGACMGVYAWFDEEAFVSDIQSVKEFVGVYQQNHDQLMVQEESQTRSLQALEAALPSWVVVDSFMAHGFLGMHGYFALHLTNPMATPIRNLTISGFVDDHPIGKVPPHVLGGREQAGYLDLANRKGDAYLVDAPEALTLCIAGEVSGQTIYEARVYEMKDQRHLGRMIDQSLTPRPQGLCRS